MKFAYFHRFQGISVVSKHLFRAIVGDDDFLVLIMDQACYQPTIEQLPKRVIAFSESGLADIGFQLPFKNNSCAIPPSAEATVGNFGCAGFWGQAVDGTLE